MHLMHLLCFPPALHPLAHGRCLPTLTPTPAGGRPLPPQLLRIPQVASLPARLQVQEKTVPTLTPWSGAVRWGAGGRGHGGGVCGHPHRKAGHWEKLGVFRRGGLEPLPHLRPHLGSGPPLPLLPDGGSGVLLWDGTLMALCPSRGYAMGLLSLLLPSFDHASGIY